MKAHKLFEALREKPEDFVSAGKGKEFENRIKHRLDRLGYISITKEDLDKGTFATIKENIQEKLSQEAIKNPTDCKNHFICQPFGSQNYPDFILFDDDRILPIEVKFTDKNKSSPMWNSGLPRPNGVYIFGSYGRKNATFFLGKDVVSLAEAKKLRDFFDKTLKPQEKEFNEKEMKNQKRGFGAYVRRAFGQGKLFNKTALVDYFAHPDRKAIEQGVIDTIKNL